MKLRCLVLSMALGAAVLLVASRRGGSAGEAAEGWFLDFLVANVRDRLDGAELPPSQEVVFVEFSEKDKSEFSAWPPAPLDYIMVLKRLARHEPDVVAFCDVLKWEQRELQFVDELQQALVGFPQVALAFSAVTGATAESGRLGDEAPLPVISRVHGDASAAPSLSRLAFADGRLTRQMHLGFVATVVDRPGEAPPLLVARADGQLVPSLAAQMIALKARAPYVSQRLRFGVGAGLHLGTGRFIPLAPDGTARPRLRGEVLRVSALEALTPDLGDEAARRFSETLGRHKLLILGRSPSPGETHVRLAAWALALPTLHRAGAWVEWVAAALMAALAFWQLRFRRGGALLLGIGAAAAMLAPVLVVFQASLTWWSPLLPGAVLLTGTAFALLWPRAAK